MSHGFFDVLFSKQHLVSPFCCPCENAELPVDRHSLNTWQRITAIFLTIVVGAATGLLGVIPAFYIITAAFKARNSVWEVYQRECPDRNEVFILNLNWWGIPHSNTWVRQREVYDMDYHVPVGQNYYSPARTPARSNVPNTYERRSTPGYGTPAREIPGGRPEQSGHVPVGRDVRR